MDQNQQPLAFWSLPAEQLLEHLKATPQGLTSSQAKQMLAQYGANMLCSEKTGTLTEGIVHLHGALDAAGQPNEKALRYDYLNAINETGFINPIDEAIRNQGKSDVTDCTKLGEVPYDFLRKRLSILIAMDNQRRLITKGALANPQILTGPEMHQMSDGALLGRVVQVDVFAEVEPNQKERIILAFKKAGNVVGYMGDGINDASALHAADVGISVESAADVAKDTADIVLLEKDLGVLVEGVQEGRVTFANTLKYVFMATSANFGNMFSMAGASLFLPFLPLLPKQILLTNLLTDFPEMAIASDNVDSEMVLQPRRWDLKFIRRFMLVFGILSSVFDYLTFGLLIFVFHAKPEQFRTGWFLESVISATLIVLVIRSRRPFFKSRPGRNLFIATLLIVTGTLILPFTPLATFLGFQRLPISVLLLLGVIVMAYIIAAEWAKKIFYKRVNY